MRKLIDFLHHFFIPRETNNFRAKTLHLDFLTYYLLIAFFLTITFRYTNLQNVLGFATDITIEKLYQLTNEQRQKNGLPILSYNEKLSQAAYQKAQDMFNRNYWAHYAPDGTTPWDFILKSGYQYEYAGENLAKNFLFSQGVVDAWMNSKTHRENILRKEYSEVGFAVVNGVLNGEQTTLVVQMFGKPIGSTPIAKNTPPSAEKPPIDNSLPNKSAKPEILAKQANSKLSYFSSFPFNLNIFFLLFLMIALVFDLYFALKLKIIRVGGKNIAHFIFLGFVLAGLFLLTRGAII